MKYLRGWRRALPDTRRLILFPRGVPVLSSGWGMHHLDGCPPERAPATAAPQGANQVAKLLQIF